MNRALNILLLIAGSGFVVWLAISVFGDSDSASKDLSPPVREPDSPEIGRPLSGDDVGSMPDGPLTPRSARRRSPEGPPPDLEDAAAMVESRKWQDALSALDRILEEAPENVSALSLRGRAYVQADMPRMAERDFRAALEKGGESVGRLVDHAAVLLRLRREREARDALAKAVEMDPTDPRAHASLAKLHFDAGRKKEAKDAADAALALDPTNPLAQSVRRQVE